MREVAELLQNLLELLADVVESLRGLWIREFAGKADSDAECDQMLLRPVMEVALDLRRSASPVATTRARVARSSVFVDWSSAVKRPFSMASSSA